MPPPVCAFYRKVASAAYGREALVGGVSVRVTRTLAALPWSAPDGADGPAEDAPAAPAARPRGTRAAAVAATSARSRESRAARVLPRGGARCRPASRSR